MFFTLQDSNYKFLVSESQFMKHFSFMSKHETPFNESIIFVSIFKLIKSVYKLKISNYITSIEQLTRNGFDLVQFS